MKTRALPSLPLLLLAGCSAPSAPAPAASAPPPPPPASATAVASASGASSAPEPPPAPPPAPALPAVELVAVDPTPDDGKPPALQVLAPTKNQVVPLAKLAAFEVKVSAKGWKPPPGDHLCVALDRRPCKPVEDPTKPIRLGELGEPDEGLHVVAVLARRASGELYRARGKAVPFASAVFHAGKKLPSTHKDGAPMLFFSVPPPGPAPKEGVLLDWFAANAEIAKGAFVVTASVGGPGIERGVGLQLDAHKPLRLKNARPGEYLSRVTLFQYVPELGDSKAEVSVTYQAKPVAGPFGAVERTFVVAKP